MKQVSDSGPPDADLLREDFRIKQPNVMETFGGSEYLFQHWWHDVEQVDPVDLEFVEAYCTNDNFLKNRLILPEEIPFLALPLVRAILQRRYQRVFFLERGTYPYLWAVRHLLEGIGKPDIQCASIRVKGLTRESFPCNLLTLLGTYERDRQLLTRSLSKHDRNHVTACLRTASPSNIHLAMQHLGDYGFSLERLLSGTRESVITELSAIGLDSRILMPNVLKTIVFQAGNLLLEDPLTPHELYKRVDKNLFGMAPQAQEGIQAMIEHSIGLDGQVSLPKMLDWMNRYVCELRGTIAHATRPLLNILLRKTQTGSTLFGPERTLYIDEVSVCGSACIALETIGKAFNPHFQADFGAVVGMWANKSFLDVTSTSFFKLKPLEDVSFLSPNYFAPVSSTSSLQRIQPYRFPSCSAVGWKVLRWRPFTYVETLRQLGGTGTFDDEDDCAVSGVVAAISSRIPWDDYPVLRRRYEHNPEVLPALVMYYLGNFEVVGEQTWFRRDPLLEVHLETFLGCSGRFQKPFNREMDRLFAWLHEGERLKPEEFSHMRAVLANRRICMQRRILSEAIRACEQYEERMCQGMEAIKYTWNDVQRFLFSDYSGTQVWSGFAELLHQLQRMVG